MFDLNVLSVAIAAAVDAPDATHAAAVAAAEPALAQATLVQAIGTYLGGERSKKIANAAIEAAVNRSRTLVEAKGCDMESVDDVRNALWADYWTASGMKGKPAKGKTDESATAYNTLFQAAKRLAIKIVGAEADEVVVPRAAQALAEQMVAFDAKVVAEALKRARAKARKAAAKAAK